MIRQYLYKLYDGWMRKQHAREMSRAAATTPEQHRSSRNRQLVAALLSFAAIVMLIEVVIAPGSMMGRHMLHAQPGAGAEAPPPSNGATSEKPAAIGGESNAKTRDAQARLETETRDLEKQWMSFKQDVKRQLGVDLPLADTSRPPPTLDGVLAAKPTASVAWTEIRQGAVDLATRLSECQALNRSINDHLAASVLRESDEHDITTALDKLESARRLLQQMRTELDHLEFLQQSQALPANQRIK